MGVAPFKQPDHTDPGTDETTLKTEYDNAVMVHNRLAGPFAVHAQEPANMTVEVDGGPLFVSDSLPTEKAQQTSNALTAPTTDKRNDIVYIDNTTGNYGIVTGVENSSPADPSIPANSFSVARIRWEVGATEITNSDIDDLRAGLMYGASTGLQQQIDALRTHDVLQDFREKVNNANTFSLNPLGFTDELNDKDALQNGAVEIPMIRFDGTNDYLTRGADLTGSADGKLGILSLWVDFNVAGDGVVQFIYDAAGNFVNIQKDVNNKIAVSFFESTGATQAINYTSTTAITSASGVTHILISWDAGNTVTHAYINDIVDAGTTAHNNVTIDYTKTNHSIGASTTGASKLIGEVGQFYFNQSEFLDFSIEANRRLFIDVNGNPVDLGSDGSKPTGTAPIIYLNNPIATWQNNLGSGGNFTENGELVDAGTITTGASDLSYNAADDTVTNAYEIIGEYDEPVNNHISLSSTNEKIGGVIRACTAGEVINKMSFIVRKSSGSPVGNVFGVVSPATGTLHTDAVGTSEILAVSSPVDSSVLPATDTELTFTFPQPFVVPTSGDYFFGADTSLVSGGILIMRGDSNVTTSAFQSTYLSSLDVWTTQLVIDFRFRLYGLKPLNLTTKTSNELGNSPAVAPTTAYVHALVQETPASMSNDWSDILNADNTGFANYTGRQRVTPVASGDEWQLRFEGHSTNPTTLDNVSIMKELSDFNGVGDITNILFGGQASITIPAGGSVLCDKFKLSMVAGVAHLVTMDFSSDTGADDFRWVITGGEGFAYKAASNSYNTLLMPSGFTEAATHTAIINLLKVGVEQTLGTDIEMKVSSDGGTTMNEVSAYSRDKVTVAGTTYNLLSGPVTLTGGGTNMMAEITGPGGHKITGKAYDIAWEAA